MRIEIPQIFWHGNRDRIMSIDFYPNTNLLITSGAESENKMFVKLWRIEEITIDPSSQGTQQIPATGVLSQSPLMKIKIRIKIHQIIKQLIFCKH